MITLGFAAFSVCSYLWILMKWDRWGNAKSLVVTLVWAVVMVPASFYL